MTDRAAPLLDFGGQGPALHIAHANGFPPGTYRQLAGALAADYTVIGLPARPLWPGSRPQDTPDWRPLAADLVRALDASGLAPVVGIGHSLGGILTLWAAIDRPDLFACVVLVDPVLLPPHWLWSLRLLRRLGLDHYQPLVPGARRRRRAWPSRQACFDHLRSKRLFARWSDAALWDYINSATEPVAGGHHSLVPQSRSEEDAGPWRSTPQAGEVVLRYSPEWEAQIFATTPVHVWQDVPCLGVPALFIRGQESNTFLPAAAARVARLLPAAQHATVPGTGHLLPMEKPAAVANVIRDFAAARAPAL